MTSEPKGKGEGAGPSGERFGRGVALVAAAKLLFIALGFVVQFGLPRILEGPEEFGLLSTAITFTVILTNAMTISMVQTASKLVAESDGRSIARPLALRHLGIAGLLAAVVLGGAEVVSSQLLANHALTPLIRLAGVVVLAYALYATAIGVLNGARRFTSQSRLDATFSVVRSTGLLGGALVLGAASSAMGGFAAAAVTMAIIGVVTAGLYARPEGSAPSLRAHLGLLAPIALYQLALNGLLQLDLTLLVTGTTLGTRAVGADAITAAQAGTTAAGLYRVAQTLAFVPYQLMTSVTLVLFPVVAHASRAGNDDEARRTVQDALRFSLLAIVLLLAPLAGASRGAIAIAFPSTYADAGPVVPVLAASQVFFGVGVIQATVLISRGRLWRTVGLIVFSLIVTVTGCLVAWALPVDELLTTTAMASVLGSVAFALLGAYALRADLGVRIDPKTALRVSIAGFAALAVANLLPQSTRLYGVIALALGALAYVVVLLATGELGARERALVARVFARFRR